MACDRLDCTTCHPPPPEPLPESRPGWAPSDSHPRQWYRSTCGIRLCAITPEPGRDGYFWLLGDASVTGRAPTLAAAQLAAERAAVPLLRAALAMLEAEQAGSAIYCEHGLAADCAVHRTILPAGPPGPMPADGGVW